MRISSISINQPTSSIRRTLKNNPSEPQKPSSENINFEGWKALGKEILKADQQKLRGFAASFHKSSCSTIQEVSAVYNSIGIKMRADSTQAFHTLDGAISTLINYKNYCLEKIAELEQEKNKLGDTFSSAKNYEITRLKNIVKNMDNKAESCEKDYYEPENTSSGSTYSDYSESPYYPYTHYDY